MDGDVTMNWHVEAPERWAGEQAIAKRLMDGVQVGIEASGTAFIEGSFSFDSEHGHRSGDFRLRITYPDNFPCRKSQPNVFLLSHREIWKNGRDSHIESNWRLCLGVGLDSEIDFENVKSLEQLLNVVATFLVRETMYQHTLAAEDRTGVRATWPGPDRAHGVRGLVESIQEHGEPGRNDPCVCGSGKKYKDCHWRDVRDEKQKVFIEQARDRSRHARRGDVK